MNKKLLLNTVFSFVILTLIAPLARAQFFQRFGYGFSRGLERAFFFGGPVYVSPYDKLITFGLLFTLFTAVFMLGLKKSMGESNRQIKAAAVAFALLSAYGITAGTNFSIAQYGFLAAFLLGVVFLYFIFALVVKFGLEEHKLLAFLIALVVTVILIWLSIAAANGTNLFGGRGFGSGFGGGGIELPSFGGGSSSTSSEDGFFSRMWERVAFWERPSASSPITPQTSSKVECEDTSGWNLGGYASRAWDAIKNTWNGEAQSELARLKSIEEQCRKDYEVAQESEKDLIEACEEDECRGLGGDELNNCQDQCALENFHISNEPLKRLQYAYYNRHSANALAAMRAGREELAKKELELLSTDNPDGILGNVPELRVKRNELMKQMWDEADAQARRIEDSYSDDETGQANGKEAALLFLENFKDSFGVSNVEIIQDAYDQRTRELEEAKIENIVGGTIEDVKSGVGALMDEVLPTILQGTVRPYTEDEFDTFDDVKKINREISRIQNDLDAKKKEKEDFQDATAELIAKAAGNSEKIRAIAQEALERQTEIQRQIRILEEKITFLEDKKSSLPSGGSE